MAPPVVGRRCGHVRSVGAHRFLPEPQDPRIPWFLIDLFAIPLFLMGLTYIVVLYVANLYDHYQDFRRRENISQIILASLIGTLVVIIIFTLPRSM